MPTYVYKAKNLHNEEMAGEFIGNSLDELKGMLHEKGFFLVDHDESGTKVTFSAFGGKVKSKDISLFCRQFSVILQAGITIVEAVSILSEQVTNKKLKLVLSDIFEELQKGKILSTAMEMHKEVFPEFLRNMVHVGEASGSLDSVMNRMADYYEMDTKVKKKVKSALTYPIVLLVLTIGVVILMMVAVLPMFAGMLSQNGASMPGITKAVMGISDFFVNNLIIILVVLFVSIIGFSYYFKQTTKGRITLDGIKLKAPLVKKVTVKVITSRFARSMAILLKSGIPIVTVVDILGSLIGNRVVEEKFKACQSEINEGHGIAGPIKRLGIFPPLLINMIAVGENTGELDEMLTRTAGFFDEEVEDAIGKLTAAIQPIMIIILAGVIGVIILSIMLPMLSMMKSIK